MPLVTVKMLEGRSDEQKKALVEKVTAAVSETTGAPVEAVTIVIEEMKRIIMQLAAYVRVINNIFLTKYKIKRKSILEYVLQDAFFVDLIYEPAFSFNDAI